MRSEVSFGSGSGVLSRSFLRYVSGEFDVDLPRNLDIEVFSLRLGLLRLCAMVFDRLGASVFELILMCVGISSGSSVEVKDRCTFSIGTVDPGIDTPATCLASNGLEIVTALGRVITKDVCITWYVN